MTRSFAIAAVVLVALVAGASAGSLTCNGTLYFKGSFAGEGFTFSFSPVGESDKAVYYDLAKEKSPIPGKPTWDDITNSVRLSCKCNEGDCTEDYAKIILRLWAEPNWRGNGGGASINMTCTPSADKSTCAGSYTGMPGGWSSRTSAAAILYNMPDYKMPKNTPKPTTPATPAGTPKPMPAPVLTPTPAVTPTPAPVPTPKPTPAPVPTPTPTPAPVPAPKPTPVPTPKPSPKAKPSPKPKPSPKKKSPKPKSPKKSPAPKRHQI